MSPAPDPEAVVGEYFHRMHTGGARVADLFDVVDGRIRPLTSFLAAH